MDKTGKPKEYYEGVFEGEGTLLKDAHLQRTDEAFKEYRRLWNLATHREIITPHPLHLDIELTNACNLRCEMCWQSKYLTAGRGWMDFGLFKKIIDNGVKNGLRAIKLQSRGESMMYPKIIEAIEYTDKSGVLDIQLTTNCTLFKRDAVDRFLKSGLSLLILSLDVDHRKSFEKLNKGKSYDSVIDDTEFMLRRRMELGLAKPTVRLQIVKLNGVIDPFIRKVAHRLEPLVEKVVAAEVFRLVDESRPIDRNEYDLLPCSYLWQRAVINWNGKVTLCCRDYNEEHVLGDVNKQPMSEIWTGPAYTRAREWHENMERHRIRPCEYCDFYARKKTKKS